MNVRLHSLFSIAIITLALVVLAAQPSSALDFKRMTLNNGAILLVAEQHQLPMVTIAVAFDAGSRRDPQSKEGLAALTAASLSQGTKDLAAADFNRKVDFMGSNVGVDASRDYATATMTLLKKYEDDTLHLMAQTIANPGLRDSDIERKRADQVAGIKAGEEEPGYVATVNFLKDLYGDRPYGHPGQGYADSVAKLTPDDVRAFYNDHYKMGSAIIAVAGDVDADSIKAKLEKEFSGPAGTVSPQPVPSTPTVPPGFHADLINRNVAQANMILGHGGISRSDPDYYKLLVMNYILGGGGFASRLMKVLRSKAGLAYTIGSGFQAGKFPAAFVIILQTKNQSSNEALKLILQQLREIRDTPVSDAELASAKKYLIGSFPLKIDRQSEIVDFMLQTELYGLGTDYAERFPKLVGSVTKAQVQQVAQKYLHPDALDLVAVADQSQAKINVANLEPQKQASVAQP